ncbi:MAG: anti-phage ZorAB system protein ZorA [Rhodothermales bacterium]
MDQQPFNLSDLFPSPFALFDPLGEAGWTPEAVTAWFCVFLCLIFALGLYRVVRGGLVGARRIGFYSDLISSEAEESTLAQNRYAVKQQALKHEDLGKLWREFDESLVGSSALVGQEGTGELYNTLDAAHFFNARTLAPELTSNRLLAAVPSFLTAIGVAGTFVGLTLGLGGIQVGENASVEAMRSGIEAMIAGASTAFTTSVWGVVLSVVFNFIEKASERRLRTQIRVLQNRIDYRYPRITAEQSLVHIASHSKESSRSLLGLAEQIGDRMQETVDQATGNIEASFSSALGRVLGPALQDMARNAQAGAQTAFAELMETFLDKMGQSGSDQAARLQSASSEMDRVLSSFSAELSTLVSGLRQHQGAMDEADQARRQALEDQVSRLVEQIERLVQEMAGQVQGMLTTQEQHLDDQHAKQREAALELAGVLEGLSNDQQQTSRSLHERLERLYDRLSAIATTHKEAENYVAELGRSLRLSAGHLERHGEAVERAAEQLGTQATSASEAIVMAAEQVQEGRRALFASLQQLETFATHAVSLTEELDRLTKTSGTALTGVAGTLGEAGDRQAERMGAVTKELQEALGGFRNQFDTLAFQLQRQQEQARHLLSEMAKQAASIIEGQGGHAERQAAQQNALIDTLMAEVRSVIEQQGSQQSQQKDDMEQLYNTIREIAAQHRAAGQEVATLGKDLAQAAAHLREHGDAVKAASSALGEQATQATLSVVKAADEVRSGREATQEVLQRLQAFGQEAARTVEALQSTTAAAEGSFQTMRTHQDAFQEALTQHVERWGEELDGLLRDYGELVSNQTQERMNDWNKNTSAYTSNMTTAVQVLSGVVDELSEVLDR